MRAGHKSDAPTVQQAFASGFRSGGGAAITADAHQAHPGTRAGNENMPAVDRRREPRELPIDGSALIQGIPFDISDWSSSGLRLRGYQGPLRVDDRLDSHVVVELPDRTFAFDCTLMVVRQDTARKDLAAVFTTLSREDRVTIAGHFEALARDAARSG